MIVLDASTLVGAALRPGGVPHRAVHRAFETDSVAVSGVVLAELLDVMHRPKLDRLIDPTARDVIVRSLMAGGIRFDPDLRVTDCRDPKDNIYLELALAAGAWTIISSDADLLSLDPWRGIRILRPAEFLALP